MEAGWLQSEWLHFFGGLSKLEMLSSINRGRPEAHWAALVHRGGMRRKIRTYSTQGCSRTLVADTASLRILDDGHEHELLNEFQAEDSTAVRPKLSSK